MHKRVQSTTLDDFITAMANGLHELFSENELDFFWRFCCHLPSATSRKNSVRRAVNTEPQQNYDSEVKRMRMVYNVNDYEMMDNSHQVLRQPWDKTKKYELVERRANTPVRKLSSIKFTATKPVFDLSNRMVAHYRSLEDKLVKLSKGNPCGAVDKEPDLPDFPHFKRIVNRLGRKKERNFRKNAIPRTSGDCVPKDLMQTLRISNENCFTKMGIAGGGYRTARHKDIN